MNARRVEECLEIGHNASPQFFQVHLMRPFSHTSDTICKTAVFKLMKVLHYVTGYFVMLHTWARSKLIIIHSFNYCYDVHLHLIQHWKVTIFFTLAVLAYHYRKLAVPADLWMKVIYSM
jgi:hypothetical protein